MIDFSTGKEYTGLDLGCNEGYFTQFLANRLRCTVVGADISKHALRRAKLSARLNAGDHGCNSYASIDFVCCDMTLLPFRQNSIDLVLCVSVLEHSRDIEIVVKEIASLIVENGILVAGYPIETSLFNALLRMFLPSGLVIRDPRIMGREKFDRSPETHKQSFTIIRSSLQKYFFIAQRAKSFFPFLPDQISWYETAKMIKKSESKLEK
jgi:2-polyprenyl-3-methyl-5-hydroxy-6-metoxy-1,4-benzoquinol methylase